MDYEREIPSGGQGQRAVSGLGLAAAGYLELLAMIN